MTTKPAPIINERLALLVLAAVQFTHILDFMITLPLGEQLMREFGIAPAQFSRLGTAYGLAAAVTGLLGGFFLDRFDRRHALLFLYAGFGLATIGCALAPNYLALLVGRLVAGAFGGIASSVVMAMVGDIVPPERRGRGMGVVMTAFPVASALGVPLSLWLANRYEWHAPFFLIGGSSLVVLIIGAYCIPSIRPTHPAAHPWTQMTALFANPIHQRGFLMSTTLVFAGVIVVSFFAPSMVANAGISQERLPLIYMAGGLATFFTTPIIGRLADRYDKLHVLGWVSIGAATIILVITNLPPVPVAVAMLVTAAFMVAMTGRFSPAMAMLSNSVEARYRGGFMSVNSAVQQASSGLAMYVAGLLVTREASGRLAGFNHVGWVSVCCIGLTYFLASRLRAIAPHAARSHAAPLPVSAAD